MQEQSLWQDKRREMAVKLRDQRREREASLMTFKQEIAEKNRRQNPDRRIHSAKPLQPPRIQAPPPSKQHSFVELCNQRSTQPVVQVPPKEIPAIPKPQAHTQPSHVFTDKAANRPSYGLVHAGNAKWIGGDTGDAYSADQLHTAPRGFPLRKSGVGGKAAQTHAERAGWAEQATKLATLENGREHLDRLLMERVARLSSSMPTTKRKGTVS